ncbi:MAG: hypothetical protein KIT56_05585, partial [Gammaproteobacteria bacterium]|nr:hypothetical protein [Gammaproteobacteria bacterium]
RFLLCFGYFFIKKSMNEENPAITILVPSLAIIFYGLMERIGVSPFAFKWAPELIFINVLSGVGMFGAYIATMQLYKLTNLASAEFPTLISSLVIQPVEAILFNVPLKANYFMPSIGFVMMSYLILNWKDKVTHVD